VAGKKKRSGTLAAGVGGGNEEKNTPAYMGSDARLAAGSKKEDWSPGDLEKKGDRH